MNYKKVIGDIEVNNFIQIIIVEEVLENYKNEENLKRILMVSIFVSTLDFNLGETISNKKNDIVDFYDDLENFLDDFHLKLEVLVMIKKNVKVVEINVKEGVNNVEVKT